MTHNPTRNPTPPQPSPTPPHPNPSQPGTRNVFEARAAKFLEAAEAKCLKWNGSTWLRARFLFGTLCQEERRRWFAADLLVAMGHTQKLDAWLSTCKVQRQQPVDAVDRELQQRLRAAQADGTLAAELGLWKFDRARIINELVGLAAEPPRPQHDPALHHHQRGTPALHTLFTHMLFVGFAHNLLLESYVSRKVQLERIHLNVGAEMLDCLFMYRARQTDARAARVLCSLRTAKRGGKRPEAQQRAAVGKALRGSPNRSRHRHPYLTLTPPHLIPPHPTPSHPTPHHPIPSHPTPSNPTLT